MNVVDKIKDFLYENKVEFKLSEHEPTPTSEIASKIRGVPLETGAKAMILRSEGKFFMFILRASDKIDFKKVKNILKTKSVSFATADEVKDVTGCVPGSVPPFGNLFMIPLYCDRNLFKNKTINFNAGLLTVSIQMNVQDWSKIIKPIIEDFVG